MSLNKPIRDVFDLDKYILPFEFTDANLKELVVKFKEEIEKSKPDLKQSIDKLSTDLHFIDKDSKNAINNLSKEFFEDVIKEFSLKYFSQIDEFLQNPINEELTEMYQDLAM